MLLQRGSVGDDLWQRFLRAEKEMEEEVKDVVAEVSIFAPRFGSTFCGDFLELSLTFVVLGKCLRAELGPNYFPVCQ